MRNALIVAVMAASIGGAQAEITGNDLKGYCRLYPQPSNATATCMAYISGALDTARLYNRVLKGQMICEPQGVTGDQLFAMTIKYLADHPQDLHYVAASLIVEMYTKAFPCRGGAN